MESGHRFDAQTLHSFIQAVFRQMGSEEQEAKLVADHLIAANLAGHDSWYWHDPKLCTLLESGAPAN